MEFKEGMIIDLEDLSKFLGVTKKTITKSAENKKKYFDKFRQCYDFVQKTGPRNKILLEITAVHNQKLPKKSGKREENAKIYAKKALKVIKNQPLQTYSSIVSTFWNDKEIMELDHKEDTQKRYISDEVKKMFGSKPGEGGTEGYIEAKVWCGMTKNANKEIMYTPLTEEEIEYFFTGAKIDTVKEINRQVLEIGSDYYNGLITEGELNIKSSNITKNTYITRCKMFSKKYGSWPVFVPKYMVGKIFKMESGGPVQEFIL